MSLPQGWVEATIGEVAETKLGKMLDAAKNKGNPVRYLRNVNVRWGNFDLDDLQEMRVTDDELQELAVRDGDLFVCEGGEPGRCAVWRGGSQHLIFQKALHRVRGSLGVNPYFLARYLTFAAATGAFSDLLTGTTIKHLPQVGLQKIGVPLPPLAEQRRIVAKLDALTARLARARADLDRIPALAEHMRRAVLTRAFGGALTAHMRPASNADAGPSPVSWQVRELGEISEIQGGIQVGKKRPQAVTLVEVPYLRVANVQRGWLRLDEIKTLGVTPEEREKLTLRPGDILMNEGGDPIADVRYRLDKPQKTKVFRHYSVAGNRPRSLTATQRWGYLWGVFR